MKSTIAKSATIFPILKYAISAVMKRGTETSYVLLKTFRM